MGGGQPDVDGDEVTSAAWFDLNDLRNARLDPFAHAVLTEVGHLLASDSCSSSSA
jgi:hypothetical protein